MSTAPMACRRLHMLVTVAGYRTQTSHVFADMHGAKEEYEDFCTAYFEGAARIATPSPTSVQDARRLFALEEACAVPEEAVSGAEYALIGQSFSPVMMYDIMEPLKPVLDKGRARPVWLLTSGMGSELPSLARLGVQPSVIYCTEIRHDAVEVLKNTAKDVFPGVPVKTTGDMRSEASRRFWSATAIWNRIDAEGIPIVISGWPCDGDSPQNAKATHSEGLSNPSTATLIMIAGVRRAIVRYLGTPRINSMQRIMLRRKATIVP